MAEYLTNTEDMKIVADAIRAKGGTSAPLEFPQGMADAVAAISGGGGEGGTPASEIIQRSATSITNDVVTYLGEAVFATYNNLQSVSFPNVVGKVGGYSSQFDRSHNLQNIYFPKLKYVNNYMFQNCKKIDYADFPEVVSIGTWAFYENKMTTLILRSSKIATVASNSLNASGIDKGTGYVYVPKALVDQYKAATNWVKYAAQIRAIEDYPEITGGAK